MSYACAHGHHDHGGGEQGTRAVFWLTCVTMVVEIFSGWAFGSMALLADGWHMASHAGAMAVAWFAYYYIRKNRDNPEFVFGAGKANSLAGFASSIGLILVSLYMIVESGARFFSPVPIAFTEAILVTCAGLAVNLISAWWLRDVDHAHNHDHNLKAAYLHVLADALTSILAIVALLGGRLYGWNQLDPFMGIVGAVVVGRWALGLMKQTTHVLLDRRIPDPTEMKPGNDQGINPPWRVKDLALWTLGPHELAARLVLEEDLDHSSDYLRWLHARFPDLKHVFIEVQSDDSPVRPPSSHKEVSHA
ncbi:cation diffusion facilitator family transporter [Desulfoplanes sp. PS50]